MTSRALHPERCWFADNIPGLGPCDGRLVRAHLIPAQRIRRNETTRRSSEFGQRWPVTRGERTELDLLVWDARAWVPACGGVSGLAGHHGRFDNRQFYVPRVLVPEQTEQFAAEHGLTWSLDASFGPREMVA